MKKIQRISSFLLAAVMLAVSGVPAFAAPAADAGGGAYVETTLTMPSLPAKADILNFAAHTDGTLDLFAEKVSSGGKMSGIYSNTYYHWRSLDGGKTWKAQNVDWAKGSEFSSIFIDGETIWGLVLSPEDYLSTVEHDRLGTVTKHSDIFNAFKVVDGKIQKVPNTAFNEEKYADYGIAGISSSNDLVVNCRAGFRKADAESQVFVVDSSTGKTKKQFGTGDTAGGYLSGNTIYVPQARGAEMLANGRSYKAFDVNTGKLQQSGKFPMLPTRQMAGENGSYYMVREEGIYRLAAGANSFVKVMAGAATVLASEKLEPFFACTAPDGTVYIIMQTSDGSRNLSLYRYSKS